MQIQQLDFVEGAKNARGIAVIIDVFRAFTTACYCLAGRAKAIYPVGEVEQAFAMASRLDNTLLIGERNGKKLAGFHLGNSPTEVLQTNVEQKNIIHTTHAGTQGLVNAQQADIVLTGALVNAQATANFIKQQHPSTVSLVRMGWKAETPTDEDNLCADYLAALLNNQPFDETEIHQKLRQSPCSQRFFDPAEIGSPASDFEHCLQVNRFDFALKLQQTPEGFLSIVQA